MDDVRQERRLVTLLFSDLSDSTSIGAGLEPEQFADLLEQIRVIAHRVIPAHGGEIVRMDGDGMLCVFGFPDAHEDAGRRATEAALDMHAAMSSLDAVFAMPDLPLTLHSGIHAGLALVRGGDVVRGKYEVLGDATNIAARLCDAAGPGDILVSSDTLGGERHFFIAADVRSIAIKGRRSALSCIPITGRAAVERRYETRERAGLTPLQGRAAEIRQFRDWLVAPSDHPPVLGLYGPAGIGKSRLLSRLASDASAEGWTVAQGYCEAYLSAPPLQAFRQAAKALALQGAADLPDEATHDAAALLQAFEGKKILLIIDDWQWADDASRDLLEALLEGADPDAFRCLLASREADFGAQDGWVLTSVALAPLDRDATLGAIEQLLASPDPFVVDRIERASGGSPLLIEELCHAFAAGHDTPGQDPRGAWFDQAVQSRFDRLDHGDRDLLKLSAVIGHMVPVWLIETLLGSRLDAARLSRLQNVDFLFPGEAGDTYRFKHGLTRDALYAGLGRDERRALHAEVLAALEDVAAERGHDPLLDGLAYHAVAAGHVDKALPYTISAGDGALAASALDRAQGHYLAGLQLLDSLPSGNARRDAAWSLLNKFGLACIVDPAQDQLPVLEELRHILAEHGSARDLQRADYWLGTIAYGVGLGKRSVRHLQSALDEALKDTRPTDIQLIRTKLAHALFASGRVADAVAGFEAELPDLANATGRNERELAAYAHAGFAFLCAERGDHNRAETLFAKADDILADPASAMNASILLYRSAALISKGDWPAAIDAADAVRAVSHRSRARMQNRTCRAQAAYARWKVTGDRRDAELLERIAREFLSGGNSRQHVSMVFGWVVEAMSDLGETELARGYMRQVIDRARVAGDRLGEAVGWRAVARAAQQAGDPVRADRYLAFAKRSAEIRLSRSEAAHNLACTAELRANRGEASAAHAMLQAAAREFEAMGMAYYRDAALTNH